MDKDLILDSDYIRRDKDKIYNLVDWWERKRLVFNLTIIAIIVYEVFFFWEETVRFGIIDAIIGSIAYIIAANVFFSIGWGLNVLIVFYKLTFLSSYEKYKMAFLVVGVLFSILVTAFIYEGTLIYFKEI